MINVPSLSKSITGGDTALDMVARPTETNEPQATGLSENNILWAFAKNSGALVGWIELWFRRYSFIKKLKVIKPFSDDSTKNHC